jgi:hypothetical protein
MVYLLALKKNRRKKSPQFLGEGKMHAPGGESGAKETGIGVGWT